MVGGATNVPGDVTVTTPVMISQVHAKVSNNYICDIKKVLFNFFIREGACEKSIFPAHSFHIQSTVLIYPVLEQTMNTESVSAVQYFVRSLPTLTQRERSDRYQVNSPVQEIKKTL